MPDDPTLFPHSATHVFPAGSTIEAEGVKTSGWYVLLGGRVGAFKRDRQIAEFARRGMIFGEIGSILGHSRTASLVALEETTVMRLDNDLDNVLAQHPKVAKALIISLAQRLERSTEALSTSPQIFETPTTPP